MGTYNYVVPGTIYGDVGHAVFDVLPYMLWGNSAADPTTVWDRYDMMTSNPEEEEEK
jgi:hypothetical protein